ncbi:MAG: M20 family metallopeptidase [Lentisphaeria bacterium]|nr:M20 family metallopeptidase [Lentisphaeria bacterium]
MDIRTAVPELRSYVEAGREVFVDAAKRIWKNPEVAFSEFKSSALLVDLLKAGGFAVEYPYAGMATAFRAKYTRGTTGATFAIAAEYDALKGIGHACGHNLIGVASVAAAIAARTYMDKHDVNGSIVVLGTPAEEGGGGKVLMLRNSDCLSGVDAVMMTHDDGDATRGDDGTTGIRRYDAVFHGRAAHAAGSPEEGLNALDAMILLCNAVGLYRQQMPPQALIHGIVTDGGTAANVIPDRSCGRFYIRSRDEALLDEVQRRFAKMVEGAALMTGTTFEINEVSVPYKARKPNRKLDKLFLDAARLLDMNVSDELPEGRGSSDFGDFTQAVPGAQPYFGIRRPGEPFAPGHSELMKEYANSDYGYEQMLNAAAALAACALKVLGDAEFRAEVRAEFERG